MCMHALLMVYMGLVVHRLYVTDPDVLFLLASRLLLLLLLCILLLLSEYCWLLRGALPYCLPLLMLSARLLIPTVHPSTLH
jgi:hypothetical protein